MDAVHTDIHAGSVYTICILSYLFLSHTQTSTATISREMSSNPLPKQSTSHHPMPIYFNKVKSHAGIVYRQ